MMSFSVLNRNKMIKLAWLLSMGLTGVALGYHFGVQRGREIPLEYYYSQSSFSEVQNTKACLDGLCEKFRTEIQARRLADQQMCAPPQGAEADSEPHISQVIADLERGVDEFAGTEQQLEIAQELFLALKKAKKFDRWVSVYLTALYRQPTHFIVARLASEALLTGRLCGREPEVITGLHHVETIPFDFEGKALVQAALRSQAGHFTADAGRALELSGGN